MQASKHIYFAPGFSKPLFSLEDAKWNLQVSFTRSEAIKYLFGRNDSIAHFIGGKLHSLTPIYVDNAGNISFGKTRRV